MKGNGKTSRANIFVIISFFCRFLSGVEGLDEEVIEAINDEVTFEVVVVEMLIRVFQS